MYLSTGCYVTFNEEAKYMYTNDELHNMLERVQFYWTNVTDGNLSNLKIEPTVGVLLLDLDNVTELSGTIPDFKGHLFIYGCHKLVEVKNNFMIEEKVKSIVFDKCTNLLKIGDKFMQSCENITFNF